MTWFLPSLGRAKRIEDFISSYHGASESAKVCVLLASWDKAKDDYLKVKWPSNWVIGHFDEVYCGPTMNAAFRRWPNENCYGFLNDDVLIRSPKALTMLEMTAGRKLISFPQDGYHDDSFATMPCIGGDLARALGFLIPEGVLHNGGESFWNDLGKRFDLLRHQKTAFIEHMHYSFKKSDYDETYSHTEKGSQLAAGVYENWMHANYAQAVERTQQFLGGS